MATLITTNEFGGDAEKLDKDNSPAYSPEEVDKVNQQWAAYTRARDAGHLDWVEQARKFDNFYVGEQWATETQQTLDAQKRPHQTINLILSTVNAVVGEYIKSRQDISFVPQGKGANQDTAKSLRFLFKQIALNNDSEAKEQQMFLDGLIQDRGYCYYYMDFSDSTEGEIRELILDPTDVILDAGAKEYDPDTWAEVFISRWLTPEEIGAFYGPEYKNKVDLAAASGTFGHDSLEWEAPNFSGDHYNSEIFFQSSEEEVKRVKRVRVIERQYRKLVRTPYFVDNTTGDMRRVPEGWSKEETEAFQIKMRGEIGVMWKPERRVRVTITADRCLLHDGWSIFNKISIIPFFPFFRRGRPFGLVRNLISPQEMLNKVTSQELHVVNTTANSGWMFKTGTLVNMDADDLVQQGSKTGLVLEWQGDAAPEKIQPNSVPSGLDQISAKSGIYFREISGVNEAMLGTQRSDSSKAIDSQRQGGMAQQEIIFDHLNYTRKLRARFMLEAVQAYYTETRLLTIFEKNEDGDDVQQELEVNQPYEQIDPETQAVIEEIKNDLTMGEYNVTVTNIPRRDTYDEALFEQLAKLREIGVQLPDHILIENSQLPDRRDVSEQVKKIQGLAAPTPEEIERAQILDEMQMRLLNAEIMEKEAQAAERQAKAQSLQVDAQVAMITPELEQAKVGMQYRMETEKLQAEERMNTMDLMARIQLMQQKNSGASNVATIQSATKRVSDALQRQASMETALINASTKEKPSDGPKKA
jgi:hypothetical protein